MERVIDFTPREWEQLKRAVDSIRVDLCRKAGVGQKPAFRGFFARRGLDLPEWKRFEGELSFPSVKDENTVVFNYYNDPRGKGGGVKTGKGSYAGAPMREVMTFSFDGERLRVPSEAFKDLETIVGFMRHKTHCRSNIMQLHEHMDNAIRDSFKTGYFQPPLFQSVKVISDGAGVSHYFFDQTDPVLENRLRHEEGAVLHFDDGDDYRRTYEEVFGTVEAREGVAPSASAKFYNGDTLVSSGELMNALNGKDYGQAYRDEVSLELAVKDVNRTALYAACVMSGVEPQAGDLAAGFVPQFGKVLSYTKGGSLSVLHGDSVFGPRSGAAQLPEAIAEVFSRENLTRIGEEYRSFCLQRDNGRSI